MTYLFSFFMFAHSVSQPVITVHGSMVSCEAAKTKLLKETPKEYRITAVCLDR